MEEPIAIPLRRKYTLSGGKSIKHTKAGNGQRTSTNKVSWKKHTGLGKK